MKIHYTNSNDVNKTYTFLMRAEDAAIVSEFTISFTQPMISSLFKSISISIRITIIIFNSDSKDI